MRATGSHRGTIGLCSWDTVRSRSGEESCAQGPTWDAGAGRTPMRRVRRLALWTGSRRRFHPATCPGAHAIPRCRGHERVAGEASFAYAHARRFRDPVFRGRRHDSSIKPGPVAVIAVGHFACIGKNRCRLRLARQSTNQHESQGYHGYRGERVWNWTQFGPS